MNRYVCFIALASALLASGCGGGSGSGSLPASIPGGAAPGQSSNRANATATLVIPAASASSSSTKRQTKFVSPSTNGVQVISYAHTDTSHTTPLGTAVTNVSSTSNACTSTTGSRTCTVAISAPLGNDDLVFTLYDTAPLSGAIPAGANILGTAGVTQTFVAGTANVVNAPISAVIVGLSGQAAFVPVAADGNPHDIGLTIAPTDFGNNAITAGTSNAPFANPITVALTETGGSGHATLELNGGAPAAQVTVSKSTDTVQVVYDGAGTAGYQIAVALSTSAFAGAGAATENATIAPALFITNKTVFWAASPAQLKAYPEGRQVLSISEPTAATGTTYTATPTGCSNVISVGTVVGTGTSASLLVAGGTAISASGCTLAISDGTATYTIAVSNTVRNLGLPVVTEYTPASLAGPADITPGTDGNLWFTQFSFGLQAAYEARGLPSRTSTSTRRTQVLFEGGGAVSTVSDTDTGYANFPLASYGFETPLGATLGGDGNVWFGDFNSNHVGQITPGGVIKAFAATNEYTNDVAPGLDGLTWFSECSGATGLVGSLSTSGKLTEVALGGAQPEGVALGSDGAIWYTEQLPMPGRIGRIVGGSAADFPAVLASVPSRITAGADGAMWFLESPKIGRMDKQGNLTEYAFPAGGSGGLFNGIIAGPDGAVWFADTGNNAIGRITTDGSATITEYPLATAAAGPGGLTVGPDGNIWFTEQLGQKIGVVQIGGTAVTNERFRRPALTP